MGSLRWLKSEESPIVIRERVAKAGGHATIYRGSQIIKNNFGTFSQIGDISKKVHLNLKKVFDPNSLFNSGRLYDFM